MHESSLAKRILDLTLAFLDGGGSDVRGCSVRAVRGWIADAEALSREALEWHFRAHARGTAAEGARLELELRHVRARCRACEETYPPEHHVLLCPRCGSNDGDILGETGLKIEAIDLDEEVRPCV